jgi:ketosteroid isomerase-like protein
MNEKLAAYTAALNRYDLDAVEKMFAEDAVYVSGGVGGEIRTRSSIIQAFHAYFHQHTDQVNLDEDVVQLDECTSISRWQLKSSKSTRSGMQRISFNNQGLIVRIEVEDD